MKWPHRSTVFVLFTALALPFACDSGSPSDDDDGEGESGNDTESAEEGDGTEAGEEGEEGEEGPAEGSSTSEGGGECSDAGEVCEVNGDCCGFADGTSVCIGDVGGCADLCDFGDECVSGCCADLEGGGGACAPPEFCG